jgi:hypothetical protein
VPEEFKLHYHARMVQIGYWLFKMSDYQHLPTQDEIGSYDPNWISDIKLAHEYNLFYEDRSTQRQFADRNEDRLKGDSPGLSGIVHPPLE